jgi:hypothetical protein
VFGICPSFKDHFLSRRANLSVTIRNFLHRCMAGMSQEHKKFSALEEVRAWRKQLYMKAMMMDEAVAPPALTVHTYAPPVQAIAMAQAYPQPVPIAQQAAPVQVPALARTYSTPSALPPRALTLTGAAKARVLPRTVSSSPYYRKPNDSPESDGSWSQRWGGSSSQGYSGTVGGGGGGGPNVEEAAVVGGQHVGLLGQVSFQAVMMDVDGGLGAASRLAHGGMQGAPEGEYKLKRKVRVCVRTKHCVWSTPSHYAHPAPDKFTRRFRQTSTARAPRVHESKWSYLVGRRFVKACSAGPYSELYCGEVVDASFTGFCIPDPATAAEGQYDAQVGDAKSSLSVAKSSLVTLRARWVTLRARWVTLRARWLTLRARWVTRRARWVTLRARWVTLRARW